MTGREEISGSQKENVSVLLTVTGKQTDPEGNTQENTAVYRGSRRSCGEGVLFSYQSENVEVLLFLSREKAWMERGGNRSARMVFDPFLSSTHCDYETAYGVIPMEVRTENIAVLGGGLQQTGSRRDLQARIRYKLVMGEDYELTCSVTIKTQQIV